jgi:hypothetical protein
MDIIHRQIDISVLRPDGGHAAESAQNRPLRMMFLMSFLYSKTFPSSYDRGLLFDAVVWGDRPIVD